METYIIAVDDDPEDIDILRVAFESTGNKTPIKEYLSGQTLLDDLEKGMPLPCLFVVDLNMPELRGIDLIPLLKANPRVRHTPVIVFSTSATPRETEILNRLEIEQFRKPSDMAEWKEMTTAMVKICEAHTA